MTSVVADGYRLLRRDRQGPLCVALYIRNEWKLKGCL